MTVGTGEGATEATRREYERQIDGVPDALANDRGAAKRQISELLRSAVPKDIRYVLDRLAESPSAWDAAVDVTVEDILALSDDVLRTCIDELWLAPLGPVGTWEAASTLATLPDYSRPALFNAIADHPKLADRPMIRSVLDQRSAHWSAKYEEINDKLKGSGVQAALLALATSQQRRLSSSRTPQERSRPAKHSARATRRNVVIGAGLLALGVVGALGYLKWSGSSSVEEARRPTDSLPSIDCTKAVNGMLDRLAATNIRAFSEALQRSGSTLPPGIAAKVEEKTSKTKAALVTACVDGRWNADAIRCVDSAQDQAAMSACSQYLTAEQVDQFAQAASTMSDSAAGGMKSQPLTPTATASSCPIGMSAIAGGTFTMGAQDDDSEVNERPSHQVSLSAFCIDTTETTVAAYARCVEADACTAAGGGDRCNASHSDRQAHPINCVDWRQAEAYCKWQQRRLPSEAEWEYAARGTDGRTYPWGNDAPSETRLNACGGECTTATKLFSATDNWPETAPVGQFRGGASPFGVLDMAGNVWEWTGDWYGPYADSAATDPSGPASGVMRVYRGGGWGSHDNASVRASRRRGDKPTNQDDSLGFRCAGGGQPTAQKAGNGKPSGTGIGVVPATTTVRPTPTVNDAPAADCSTALSDPKSWSCVRVFCATHGTDPRCASE